MGLCGTDFIRKSPVASPPLQVSSLCGYPLARVDTYKVHYTVQNTVLSGLKAFVICENL